DDYAAIRFATVARSRFEPSSVINSHEALPKALKITVKVIIKEEITFVHGLEEFLLSLVTKVFRIGAHLIDAVLHCLINLEPFVKQIEYSLLLSRTQL